MNRLKANLRLQAYAARNTQAEKDKHSEIICAKFLTQKAYLLANTVMWYVHCRSEVRTIPALVRALKTEKQAVVPYCTKDSLGINKLGLWRLQELAELSAGTWGILEPPQDRWEDSDRQVDPKTVDVVMVPGVAFDRQGGRLGNGAGYFDRLLKTIKDEAVLIGVCYEAQVFTEIPMDVDDVFMDLVITEKKVYKQDAYK